MKTLITATIIAMSTITVTSAQAASSVQECISLGDSIHMLGELRDRGLPASVVYDYLVHEGGLSGEIVMVLINTVYLAGANFDPDTLETIFVSQCVNGLA